jgi:uncharacterized protein
MAKQLNYAKLFQHVFVSAALLFCTSCGNTRDEYYGLRAISPGRVHRADGVSVGVGSISLPSYIDRAELVFQTGKNQFEVSPNARWIGALRDNIARVLADDLHQTLHSENVSIYPWPREASPRYVIIAEIRQFHGISGNDAILEVSWRIEENGKIVVRRNDNLLQPIIGDGYAAVVEAESQLLERFAEKIARSFPEH